jgi:hypothetical protein
MPGVRSCVGFPESGVLLGFAQLAAIWASIVSAAPAWLAMRGRIPGHLEPTSRSADLYEGGAGHRLRLEALFSMSAGVS